MTRISQEKIQEMQNLEQNLQNLIYQKQAFQMELSETSSALKEIEKSDGEVFKIIGQLMLKTEKKKIKEELSNKEKILNLRINSIEKQEASLNERLEEFREEIMKSEK
jgi:prefoldin beta subunit